MKYRYYSIINLAVAFFYILRPALPYLEYAINRDYIEKNLCVEKSNPENNCHGKCHLQALLNKQAEPPDSESNDNKKFFPDRRLDDHLKEYFTVPRLFVREIKVTEYFTVPDIVTSFSDIFVPPKI
jgi:hypothetical protein